MFKQVLAAVAALPLAATAALAGPYANVENSTDFFGGSFDGALTEFHVGYETEVSEDGTAYIQFGPALTSPTDSGTSIDFSAYVGGEVSANERTTVYGELGLLTGTDTGLSTEVGVRYDF